MYSNPAASASDHFRGTWNAPIADSQHASAEFNCYSPERVACTDHNNPFDTAFGDLAAVAVREVDPHFKTQLASKMEQRRRESYPLAGPPSRQAPTRLPPTRQPAPVMMQPHHSPTPAYYTVPPMQSPGAYNYDAGFQASPNPALGSPNSGYFPGNVPMMSPIMPDYSSSRSLNTLSGPQTVINDDAGWDMLFDSNGSPTPGSGKNMGSVGDLSTDSDDESSIVGDENTSQQIEAYDDSSLGQVIPGTFDDIDTLKTFLLNPIECNDLVKCVVMYDSTEKMWTFINQSNGVQLMTAYKRKDGLKRLTTQMNWSINFSPRAVSTLNHRAEYGSFSVKRKSKKKLSENYLAKMKSKRRWLKFEIFDTGLNPSKAVGAMHARRELGAIRFEKMPNDAYRRRVSTCVPSLGHNRRPQSRKELMFERLSQGDHTVFPMVNHLPGKSYCLPKLYDFKGMAMQSSVKNMMLHSPKDESGDFIYVLGKTSNKTYNCYFKEPISPVMAFSMALASISSYVNPSKN
eukprot:CAMPEP_0203804390 /NCGR_PEP_ID=MMETSP0100_2-20121128/13543_1 /ASSEMBLY_ACC=CAM_ASM_000210 /TAXON_ID=96639 /ORGANISM=" , Strain NY0313808BC1" /LENGTH=515 /DNA_ID=CAMNT_0050712573 /DNA_START=132 /DNA_END=1680 /DNA_ORIENTATION=+